MLSDALTALGLGTEEAEAYTALLESGPTTAGALAKTSGIPRPSLYGFLKRLEEKGLVSESQKGGVKVFAAEPPRKVSLLFQQRIAALAEEDRVYQTLIPQLEKLIPANYLAPKFQVFEGATGIQHVLKDMLLYGNIETQAFWPIKTMIATLSPEFFEYHNKERVLRNISVRALWPQDQVVSFEKHPYLGTGAALKRETRVTPKEVGTTMGYWIYGNKVVFLSSRKESFAFIVESRELAELMRVQFEVVWGLSKPIKATP